MSDGLYQAVRAFSETDEAAGLAPTEKRFLEKTLDDFQAVSYRIPFIAELKQDAHGAKLGDAILAMSDGLNLPVTAECVENELVLETLKRMGKMKGQGYHYGRPEPAPLVLERLGRQDLLAGLDG